MRKIFPWLILPLIVAPLIADESAGQDRAETRSRAEIRFVRKPMPWVGLKVGKLTEVMRAHSSGVPEGVGFLVESVAVGGPAISAGIQRYDILWKFDDQLLVNEAQLATLLRLREAGDEVKLAVVRSGLQLELDLVLAEAPANQQGESISAADLPLIPSGVPGMPTVITRPQDRTAEITRADGSVAKLYYKDGAAYVTITGVDEETIYEGPVRKDCDFVVPDEWKGSVGAMLRSLYKAKNPNWVPRRPRPRVVIPASQRDR